MAAQEQNKMLNITKFMEYKYECYINPKYISRIFKAPYNDYYQIDIGDTTISLYSVITKAQLNEFLDYIHSN